MLGNLFFLIVARGASNSMRVVTEAFLVICIYKKKVKVDSK